MWKFVAVTLIVALPSPALASRVINISVELDGKTILEGENGDDGFAGRAIVWRYLMERPLQTTKGFVIPLDPDNPSMALLKGKIVVRVQYGADAHAKELRLKRAPGSGWIIDPVWVEANAPAGDLREMEQTLAARRAEHQRDRDGYRLGTFIAVGFALASLVGCLIALVAFFMGVHRARLVWLCIAGLGLGGMAVVLRFIGSPYLPDDDRFFDLRTYAMYAGVFGCGVAACLWLLGCRLRGAP